MTGIIDQHGNPIPSEVIARLREEEAAPTPLTSVRPAYSMHQADGLTPAKLAQIHREAAQGYGRRYLELAEDIEERDLHYAAVLRTRKLAVTQLPITVEAASEDEEHVRHADFVRDWLTTGLLEEALMDVVDAIGKGFSVHEMIWAVDSDGIRPEKLLNRPQRWFDVDRVDMDAIGLREGTTLQPLTPHKFLVHRHKAKSGLLLRSGLARLASWGWMWKAFTVRDWAVFVQNYGQPMRLGKYGPNSTPAERDILWQAVAGIAGDCAAIVPAGMEIEFIEVGDLKAGAELYEKKAEWLNREISKAVLGQTTTTDAVSGGHAVAKEHRLVQEDIERADARMVATSITRQVVQAMVAFTFGPQKKYPKALIGRPDEIPLEKVITGLKELVPLGLKVEMGAVRDRLGFAEPDAGAELLQAKPAAAAPPPADPAMPPPPPPKPPAKALNAVLALAAQQVATPELVERMTERLALDAQGALAGMSDQVLAELEAATDWPDAMARIARLNLDTEAFGRALGQAQAIAFLAGRAEVLDELAPPAGR